MPATRDMDEDRIQEMLLTTPAPGQGDRHEHADPATEADPENHRGRRGADLKIPLDPEAET